MFAVIEIGGKQYQVSPKDKIIISKYKSEAGAKIEIDRVVLVADESQVHIGQPYLKNYKVKAIVASHGQGEKIHVRRYKSKVRHRRHIGFRPQTTSLEIVDIIKA